MNGSKLFIPLAIVVAGLVVAGAILFSGEGSRESGQPTGTFDRPTEIEVEPLSEKDHVLGNPNGEVVIIEYSDFECPFCGRFHPTMEEIISEYGDRVAWAYRHFPLDQIHRDARDAAEASECVAELNGNAAFWEYSAKLFEGTPESLTDENLLAIALEMEVDEAAYNECVESGRHEQTVEDFYQSGFAIAQADPQFGTPYSIVMTKDGSQKVTIPGAQPYNVVKQIIDSLLGEQVAE